MTELESVWKKYYSEIEKNEDGLSIWNMDIDDLKYKFCSFVHNKDRDNDKIDFNKKSGCLYSRENYKKEVYTKVQNILELNQWQKDWVGTGEIAKRVFEAIKANENLISWHEIDSIKKILSPSDDRQVLSVEKTFYKLYIDSLDKDAFEELIETFGARYDILAYLMFIKDKDKYLPTRSSKFDEAFIKMKVDFTMTSKCSWDNYLDYCNIIKSVLMILQNDAAFTNDLCLLDAHSFVWILINDDFTDWCVRLENDSIILEEEIKEVEDKIVEGKDREAVVKQRVNQGKFRERLLRRYSKCCLCNVSNNSFLVASHIKPWRVANSSERVDENNGFLLCPNHDALFDGGYISFTDDGKIIISDELSEVDRLFMNVNENMKIDTAYENNKYLKWHRENEFEKWK